jgi:hypothetical protein
LTVAPAEVARLQGFLSDLARDARTVLTPTEKGVAGEGLIATVGRIPAQDAKEAST